MAWAVARRACGCAPARAGLRVRHRLAPDDALEAVAREIGTGRLDRVIVSGVRADDDLALGAWAVEREIVDDGWRTLLLTR